MIGVGAAAVAILSATVFKPHLENFAGKAVRAIFETGGGRPRGKVGVMNASGQFQDVEFLFDTGNDITLITTGTATQLGLDPNQGQKFTVSGVGGDVKDFRMIMRPIKIGNDDPITVRLGIGDVPENLLGYQDIAPEYVISYSKNRQVIFEEAGAEVVSKVAVSSNHDSLETRAVDRRFWWY